MSALLLFGSILLHEPGRAVVARRHGVEIEEIDLWLLNVVILAFNLLPAFPIDGGRVELVGGPSTPAARLSLQG